MRFALAQPRRGRDLVARGRVKEAAQETAVALIPAAPPSNPYLSLLYTHLEPLGIKVMDGPALRTVWLWRNRQTVDILHFNWPEGLYRYQRRPVRLQRPLSWAKLVAFAARLAVARAFGYRLVWTVHQVYPHETNSRRLDRMAGILLGRSCDLLLAHDEATAAGARRELGRSAARIEVLAHGSYVGVYPAGRARAAVRAELGIPDESFVFLSFGELRAYKDVELVLDAFSEMSAANVALLVAGYPKDQGVGSHVASAAEVDRRIKPLLRYIRDKNVAELFGASDAAVIARGDGGTSGSLVLALSMGLPVVVADQPAYRSLVGDGGWFFQPGRREALRAALEQAAEDRGDARRRGRVARAIADRLAWPEIARQAAVLFTALGR